MIFYKLHNGVYYKRFHYMNAWYNTDYIGDIDFLSYDTYLLTISYSENYKNPDFFGCRIYFMDYRGTSTQKQITRFIKENCGIFYAKHYKKARYLLRKSNGNNAILYRDKFSGKYTIEIRLYSETIKKVVL